MKVYLKNNLRKFDSYRRDKMHSLENLMYRLIKNDSIIEKELLAKENIKRVLIIRNNKRIGNILFLIPFLRETRLAYPDAKIDLMLTEPWQGNFVTGLGIDNIYYSNFSLKGFFKWLGLIKQLNKVQYDLILAPNCCASDSFTTAMTASRNKVSFYNERRILPFPNALKVNPTREHAALANLTLLEELGHQLSAPVNHNLAFSEEETQKGIELSKEYLAEDGSINLVFFRGARGVKLLNAQQWESILCKFEAESDKNINWTEILSPDITEPLRANTKTFSSSNMRELGCFLQNFDGFICCDTGPLHLADASHVKCIGFFTHTPPNEFGLLGEHCFHITDLNNFKVSEIAEKLNF